MFQLKGALGGGGGVRGGKVFGWWERRTRPNLRVSKKKKRGWRGGGGGEEGREKETTLRKGRKGTRKKGGKIKGNFRAWEGMTKVKGDKCLKGGGGGGTGKSSTGVQPASFVGIGYKCTGEGGHAHLTLGPHESGG